MRPLFKATKLEKQTPLLGSILKIYENADKTLKCRIDIL